jgi:hypothetical protein
MTPEESLKLFRKLVSDIGDAEYPEDITFPAWLDMEEALHVIEGSMMKAGDLPK